jgi:5'(3')-deoxyribonucleotidase
MDIKKIIYVDMDNVLCNIKKLAREKFTQFPDMKYPQSQYGFFIELEEIENAVKSVKNLQEECGFDIWFLTAPSWQNPMCYAEKNYWIRQHFGLEWCKKLIICNDKSLLRGQYLIDDNIMGRGQDKFTGKFIHFGSELYPNWLKVMERFNNK